MIWNSSFKGPISIDDLVTRLHEICDGIERNGDIWKVGDEEHHFILGPLEIARFDLIDPEYGWPSPVYIDEPITTDHLKLGRRHHPLLVRGGRGVAIVIGSGEYDTFRRRSLNYRTVSNGFFSD